MSGFSSYGSASISREQHYYDRAAADDRPVTKRSFAEFYRFCLKKRSEAEGRRITTRAVAAELGISYELFRKIVNRETPTKKRDCILAVCAVLRADPDDTNGALRAYGDLPQLDQNDPRDSLIWDILCEQAYTPKTLAEINEAIARAGFPQLDIIRHKSNSETPEQKYPGRLIRKHFQCTVGGISRISEPDAFLDLMYDPECFYNMQTYMEFEDGGRRCEITVRTEEPQGSFADSLYLHCIRRRLCPPKKTYIVYAYPDQAHDSELHEYDSIAETGAFRESFLEIEQTERDEYRKLLRTLNDTRNYGSRISARVTGGALHVFCEEYNCDVPELSEYYLMDYCRGACTLYVTQSSCFMKLYLSEAEYERIYGKPDDFYLFRILQEPDARARKKMRRLTDPVLNAYESVEDIELSAYETRDVGMYESYSEGSMTVLRIKAYQRMEARIRKLTERLKTGQAHICDPAVFDGGAESLLPRYLGIADGSECTLSDAELRSGFALGLRTADEIRAFLQQHGTLDISALL